jgi:chromosome segregation ATPase
MKDKLETVNGEQAQAEREKAEQELQKFRDEAELKQKEIDGLEEEIRKLTEDFEQKVIDAQDKYNKELKELQEMLSAQSQFKEKLEIANYESERLHKQLKKQEQDNEDELREYRNKIDKMKDDYLKQMDDHRKLQETLDDENK